MVDEKPLPKSPAEKLAALEQLAELGKLYAEAVKVLEAEEEEFWNSLSREDQLKVFCAVSRRIYDGEIKVKGSYRYVLYDVFGFGPEAYGAAQNAGYLAIHNAIVDESYDRHLLDQFCKLHGIDAAEEKINKFIEQNI